MNLSFLLVLALFIALPLTALSQGLNIPAPTGQVINIANILLTILNIVWLVAITTSIIFFVLAGFKFLTAQGKPEELVTARRFLIGGVLGVVVIILSFSIITVVQNTFGLT